MTEPDVPKNLDDELLGTLKTDYQDVRKLLDKEPNEEEDRSQPYKSKYAALEILKKMRDALCSLDNSLQNDDKVSPMLGVIYLNLGIVYIETDELKSGEENLTRCIETLNQNQDDVQPGTVLALISALNQLGILWSRRDQPSKARVFLERAELAYKDYKKTQSVAPVGMATLFGVQDDNEVSPEETVEKLHTLTLYYIAQIYGSLEMYMESAIYCHSTLCRQLEHKDFDSIDWALNAATLSQFFMEKGVFSLARHHLGAATYILQQYKQTLEKNEKKENEETLAARWETFNHRSADVARCWAKYGILLMNSSRERLMETEEEVAAEEKNRQSEVTNNVGELKFSMIENEIETIVAEITDQYLLVFNDAAAVFKVTKKWLDEAKSFYTLENHASDYVQVVQDFSQAYKYLAFFEPDEGRRAKMHKRRIDILESVIKELNPKYYMGACREIWMELGETYSEIRDIKYERLRNIEEKPPMHLLSKTNHLTDEAIKNYQHFLDSLKEYENSDGVKKFPDEMIRPALVCYFNLGRLYNLHLNSSKEQQLDKTRKSLEAYMFLVNYCEKDSKARELMMEELNICKELVKLLPLKINKMVQQAAS